MKLNLLGTPNRDRTYTATFTRSGSFKARYFDNQELSGSPALVRDDPAIGFSWGSGSPGPSIPVDHWSARWTKDQFFAGGRYRFTVTADDGVRLYVDGRLRIDQWRNPGVATHSIDIDLSRGNHWIKMEYNENKGNAGARLAFDLAPVQPNPASVPQNKQEGRIFRADNGLFSRLKQGHSHR